MSRRRVSKGAMAAVAAAALALAGCGGGGRQDVAEPSGNFQVSVVRATWPNTQRLAQHTHLVISVRNAGSRAIPDLAVTICSTSCSSSQGAAGTGSGTAAFSEILKQPGLANPSRPVWIIDRPPGRCTYSCQQGGPGAAVTAYTNTWALGRIAPGATATFDWGLTAVKPGHHVVSYKIAAGLNGKAKAVLAGGAAPAGRFDVTISRQPTQSYVGSGGQVVNKP